MSAIGGRYSISAGLERFARVCQSNDGKNAGTLTRLFEFLGSGICLGSLLPRGTICEDMPKYERLITCRYWYAAHHSLYFLHALLSEVSFISELAAEPHEGTLVLTHMATTLGIHWKITRLATLTNVN